MIFASVIALALSAASSAPPPALLGRWDCEGRFVKSGRPIAATLDIAGDPATGAIVLHHDDKPPGRYHSVEIWPTQGEDRRAALIDSYSGLRVFESSGWVGDSIRWTRMSNGVPAESFTYALAGGTLRIDWSVSEHGAPLQLGDTLLCRPRP